MIVMIVLPFAALSAKSSAKPQKLLSVNMTVLNNASSYTLNDSIVLRFQITNVQPTPIGIFTELGMGYQGGVILHVLRSDGSEVQKPVLSHFPLQPSDITNKNNYIELLPNHFIGMVQTFKVSDLVRKPGNYKLLAEYHSPVDSSHTTVRNFFGVKENSVVSNEIELNVRP